jgi:hypothetical protein
MPDDRVLVQLDYIALGRRADDALHGVGHEIGGLVMDPVAGEERHDHMPGPPLSGSGRS